MIFILKSTGIKVAIEDHHIKKMRNLIKTAGINETGGIILGSYTDSATATVSEIMDPPEDSRAGRYWFERGIKGLKSILTAAWNKNQYYLGEWHYHPNGTVEPSYQDYQQMSKISKSEKYYCPEPIMIIIAGNFQDYKLGVYISDRNLNKTFKLEQFTKDAK
ncbi:Mov34/MPN/PAD-1 family protein [Flavobacterium sp. UGB4466]|uniref:Mov34/MPN/PAD-1 family protein n=1 Tax=Flavobacterium sp. UGB4466 TaxID=2730889 RepID=UPI00192B5880|nr:Mov34/MPN/PAD-1 family protein [Flavobacterium sp. UGB4466]